MFPNQLWDVHGKIYQLSVYNQGCNIDHNVLKWPEKAYFSNFLAFLVILDPPQEKSAFFIYIFHQKYLKSTPKFMRCAKINGCVKVHF